MNSENINVNLHEAALGVKTRKELAEFERNLLQDFESNRANWKNDTLEAYLDAIARILENLDQYFRAQGSDTPEQPTWSTMAQIMLAAKNY